MEEKRPSRPPIPDSPCMNAVRMLMRVMRRHHAGMERRISDLGVHHSQHRTLMELIRRQEQPPSQRELAEIMGVSPAAVTTILKKMEREGLVSRSMTHEDNRVNQIRITEKGIAKVNESRNAFESADCALFAGFTPEEMTLFVSFLERLDKNLDAVGAPVDPPPPRRPDRKPPHPTRPTERK